MHPFYIFQKNLNKILGFSRKFRWGRVTLNTHIFIGLIAIFCWNSTLSPSDLIVSSLYSVFGRYHYNLVMGFCFTGKHRCHLFPKFFFFFFFFCLSHFSAESSFAPKAIVCLQVGNIWFILWPIYRIFQRFWYGTPQLSPYVEYLVPYYLF